MSGRFAKIGLLALAIVLVLTIGAVAVLTGTSAGRASLAGMVSQALSNPERRIGIGSIKGIWSGNLSISHVVVEDGETAWLLAKDIEIHWSPLKLLSGSFSADLIRAGRVEIARPPQTASSDRSEGSTSLPLRLDIRAIDLPQILLDDSLAGGIARMSARASMIVDTAPVRIEADATLSRTDGTDGSLQARIVYHPEGDRLDLDLKGSEPGDGILVNLLGIEGRPRVDLLVSGSGPAAAWTGEATLAFDGSEAARVSAAIRQDRNGRILSADGSGAFDLILPQPYAGLMAGGAKFEIVARADDSGAYAIERAGLRSTRIAAEASGTFDPQGSSDIRFAAHGVDGPVRLQLNEAENAAILHLNALTASLKGPGNKLALVAEAELAAFNLADISLSDIRTRLSSDGFDPANISGPFKLGATAKKLQSTNADLQRLAGGGVMVSASGRVNGSEVTLDSAMLEAGHLNAGIDGRATTDFSQFDLNSRIEIVSAGLPGAVASLAGDKLAIDAQLNRGAEGVVSVGKLMLDGAALKASGEARLDGDKLQSSISGELSSLKAASDKLAGTLSFSASAEGSVSAPSFKFEARSDVLEAIGKSITDLALTAEGIADPISPSADIRLSGRMEKSAIDGAASLSTREGQKSIERARIAIGENAITGDLRLDAGFRPTGVLNIALPDLSQIAALALQQAEGDLRGTAEFLIVADVPILNVRAGSARVRSGEIVAEGLDIDAVVEDYLSKPGVSGTIGVARLLAGKTNVADLAVDLEQDQNWTRFSGSAQVDGNPAELAGGVRAGADATTIKLASGKTNLRGLGVRLGAPSQIIVRDSVADIEQLALVVGGGKVDVSGTAGETLALTAKLTTVSASAANVFVPALGANGSVSGLVTVSGVAATPTIAFDLSVTNASVAQSRAAGLKGLSIKSDGRFADDRLAFKAVLSDAAGLSLNGGGSVQTGARTVLDLDITGTVPMQLASAGVAAQGIKLRGAAKVDLKISGSPPLPDISGTISTANARFIDARSGIAINKISADIGLSSAVATVRLLRGELSTGGNLSAKGTIGIRTEDGLPADLSLSLRNGRYTDGELVTANLGGDLTLKGPITAGGILGGRIDFGKVTVRIPDTLPGSLARLDVKHKNAPARVQKQADALQPSSGSNDSSSSLGLDVILNAPSRIFIRGRGLDAELGGSLKLSGTTGSPRATGRFNLIRGRLSILGRRLTFTEGTAGFSGSLVPVIDLTAETTTNDATVSVRVSGSADDPKFTFSSSPSLPEDEVLAQLVFGQSLSNLSPLQIAQLADAVAELSGVGGSSGLLGKLRSQIGVDDIDVKSDSDTGDTSVAVGKYLNDRTYLSIEKGSKAGSGKATIDLSIGRGLKLRGQASDSGETKGGIFFERDY